MSLERVLKTLEGFGFTKMDAEVYVYIAKKGPQTGTDIINSLKIRKQQLYIILKKLQSKGVLTASYEQPPLFSALAFGKALDLLVKDTLEQVKAIKENKEGIVASLRDRTKQDTT